MNHKSNKQIFSFIGAVFAAVYIIYIGLSFTATAFIAGIIGFIITPVLGLLAFVIIFALMLAFLLPAILYLQWYFDNKESNDKSDTHQSDESYLHKHARAKNTKYEHPTETIYPKK